MHVLYLFVLVWRDPGVWGVWFFCCCVWGFLSLGFFETPDGGYSEQSISLLLSERK